MWWQYHPVGLKLLLRTGVKGQQPCPAGLEAPKWNFGLSASHLQLGASDRGLAHPRGLGQEAPFAWQTMLEPLSRLLLSVQLLVLRSRNYCEY